MLDMAAQGYSQREIGSTLGISAARVNQIIREAREAIDPDAARARLGEILDKLMKQAAGVADLPAPPVVSPSGKPVYHYLADDDGSPILDKRGSPVPDITRPIVNEYARLEAHKILIGEVQTYAKLFGLDRKPQEKDDSGSLAEIVQYMEHLEAANRDLTAKLEEAQGTIIEGEIVN